MKTILIIEDEAHITRFIKSVMEQEGYQVYTADSSQRGLIEAASRRPDLLILDLGLPDADGCEVISDIRTWSSLPILVLSARSDEQDKIKALNLGADDYLVKPFSMGELIARVNAHMRRWQVGHESAVVITLGNVSIDLAQRHVKKNGEDVHLTPIEYRLLTVLIKHAEKVMTHQQLLNEVWGKGHNHQEHYVRIFMSNLRQKLEDNPSRPNYFFTEIGVGYKLHIPKK
ncbi:MULTISPECIES: response regulator [Psychrobacter]|jgi:two-component system KDP operon response regulator KdpE|uniref:response regulator n=1 Tax=Psychrobacter TaxID=497 RepID=UPI000EF0036A|nr:MULTISPECIES: response regulator [Psychrobacter]HCN18538.1 DNA-binding response regulator [Psychrobacter sp.]